MKKLADPYGVKILTIHMLSPTINSPWIKVGLQMGRAKAKSLLIGPSLQVWIHP